MYHEGIEELMRRGDWDGAATACDAILQIQPTNAKVIGLMGMCEFRRCEFVAAETTFRKATALDPNFVDAGVKLAQCLERQKRYEEAYNEAAYWQKKRPNDRILSGMVEFLKPYARGNRQGWEQNVGLGHTIRFASEDR
ncbi:hypothetical protein EON81_22615 [bacterium]|nr:MAG: hypothetical protein EON81_22615 [bacterium]